MGNSDGCLAKIRLCMTGDMTVTPRLRYLAQGCPPLPPGLFHIKV